MYRSKSRLGGRASTLGVAVDWLGDPYQATICKGIEEGAANAGANLLFFVGGVLPAHPGTGLPRHQIFGLAGRHNLDGLIVLSSTLSHEVGPEGVRRFCEQFVGVPLCSVGVPMPRAPSVTVDNEAGMSAVVRHVVEHHGARRVAFISGPTANAESQIRVSAYHAVLDEKEIPAEDRCVVPGTFLMESGGPAVHSLTARFGEKLERLDAIVAANDNMAIGAMDELSKMGVLVPESIAVMGFDDIEEARLTEPSLSTARQPLVRIGKEALRRVMQEVGKQPEDLDLRISTELLVRQSCGCSGLGTQTPPGSPSSQRFEVALMGKRPRILAQLGRAARGRFAAAGADWEQHMLNALVEDLTAGATVRGRFMPMVERLILRLAASGMDVSAMDEVLNALRDEIVPAVQGDPQRHCHAEDLFHGVRLATSGALQRGAGRAHLNLSRWARAIAVVCNALSAAESYQALGASLRKHLPELGLRSCFVVTYDPKGGEKAASLVCSHGGPDNAERYEGKSFRAGELLPPQLVHTSGKGRSFAVLPLLGARDVIGHVLFEYTAEHAFACGVLSEAISIAVRRVMATAGRA